MKKYLIVLPLITLCSTLSFALTVNNKTHHNFSMKVNEVCLSGSVTSYKAVSFDKAVLSQACTELKNCQIDFYVAQNCSDSHAFTVRLNDQGDIKKVAMDTVPGKPIGTSWRDDNVTIIEPIICWPQPNPNGKCE